MLELEREMVKEMVHTALQASQQARFSFGTREVRQAFIKLDTMNCIFKAAGYTKTNGLWYDWNVAGLVEGADELEKITSQAGAASVEAIEAADELHNAAQAIASRYNFQF